MKYEILKRKILRNLNDYGFLVFFKKMLSYPLKPFFENVGFILFEIDLNNIREETVKKNGFSFKWVEAKDHQLINAIEDMEEWLRGRVKEKLSNNSMCMAVLTGNQLLGFYLASFGGGHIPLLRLRVIAGNGEAWGDQITIEKGSRKLGLGTELKRSIYAEFKRKGIKNIFAATRVYNKASLELSRKFGIQKAFRFNYIKLFTYRRLVYWRIQLNKAGFCKRGFFAWLRELKNYRFKSPLNHEMNGRNFEKGKPERYLFIIKTEELN
jgi:ribosomal protein S18 acetylase RimI-like enzyme